MKTLWILYCVAASTTDQVDPKEVARYETRADCQIQLVGNEKRRSCAANVLRSEDSLLMYPVYRATP
jgi:hypothetical protein